MSSICCVVEFSIPKIDKLFVEGFWDGSNLLLQRSLTATHVGEITKCLCSDAQKCKKNVLFETLIIPLAKSSMSDKERVRKNHHELYKAKTPPWKETYRKRCIDRLRQSRDKLQDRFRKINTNEEHGDEFIKDLMRDELKLIRREQAGSPSNMQTGLQTIEEPGDDIDNILSLFDDIQAELMREEMKLLQEYDLYKGSLRHEENSLCTAIERLCTVEVICPVCQKNPMMQNKSVVFCKCGMRVDTEQDCLTLTYIKQTLDDGTKQHSEACDYPPVFSVVAEVGSNNLLMSCEECDFLHIVI
ncbi:hypothetical protein ScPMuIL_006705 [Solemya velum]